MTDREKIEMLEKRIVLLENTLVAVLRHNANISRSSARRLRNLTDRQMKQAELFEGLAYDMEAEHGRTVQPGL